jgi:uncharacterized protein YjiS (DUF1127 family)
MPKEYLFTRTPIGQLLYDLAFTDLDRSYVARKHGLPVADVDRLRANPHLMKLRRKVKADRAQKRRRRKARHGHH